VDYFLGAQHTTEDGWRKYSPSHINQTFGKIGWQNEKTKLNLSYIGAYNNMIGNGLTPIDMLGNDRDGIHTTPDQTKNYLNHFALNGAHWLSNDVMLSGNAYYRTSNRNTLNGDANDDFKTRVAAGAGGVLVDDRDDPNSGVCSPNGNNDLGEAYTSESCAPGIMNRSRLKSRSLGFNIQAAFNQDVFGKKNQLITGLGFDSQRIKLLQTEQLSEVTSGGGGTDIYALSDTWFELGTRKPINLDEQIDTQVNLGGRSKTTSLFATDTLSLNQFWHVTASARYNYTKVKNRDHLNASGSAASLSGDHSFNRINPSIGLTFTPTETLSIFGSYSESSRAPTSIELGCANPAVPCKLPNAMASDPPLDQVVSKTYDFGMRGQVTDNLKWNASVYRTINHNDIHFINSSSYSGALGYFDNVGRTKRQGLDLGLTGSIEKLSFKAGYSFISAKYDSDLELINEVNSSANADGVISVRKGNYLAGIPKHQFKLRLQYNITPQWSIGSNVVAYSDQFVHGNENNAHDDSNNTKGKLNGYTVMNLDTQYNIGQGWHLFAKAINIFDKDYYTGGRLAETMFSAAGDWGLADRGVTSVVPGAPQAAWLGVRYEFGGATEAK
jgi:outer membrane receptor protein involved in Fe transport